MDRQFQPLLQLLDQLSDEFVELREGVRKAILIADHDPEMALTRTRKVLEYIVRDVYGRRCNEKPGTQPLENLLQRLSKDGYVPKRVSAYANAIRDLGNVGTHTFGEGVSMDDVRQSLGQLVPVLEWYVKVERPDAVTTTNERRRDSTRDAGIESAKRRSFPRNELYQRYFNTLCNELRERGEKGSPDRSWCNVLSGASGIVYNMYFTRGGRACAGLYISNNKPVFDALFVQREAIERELGEVLDWQRMPERRFSRITLCCDGSIEDSEERLAAIRTWHIDRLLRLKRVFGPRLVELNLRRRAH